MLSEKRDAGICKKAFYTVDAEQRKVTLSFYLFNSCDRAMNCREKKKKSVNSALKWLSYIEFYTHTHTVCFVEPGQ